MNPTITDSDENLQSRLVRYLPLLLIGIFLVRLAYLLLLPIDLVGDEAYYWDWGRRPDFGYFSKPPGIAWIMSIAGWLGNPHDWAIRAWSIALATTTLGICFELARRLFDERTALWFLGFFALMPAAVVQNLVLTTDALLMFFWALSLLLFWMWCEMPAGSKRTLIGLSLIVTLGLGYLGKQMMLVFPVLGFVYLLTERSLRGRLVAPGPYIVWLASLAFLIPTLLWNAEHGWITFQHTSDHFSGRSQTIAAVLARTGGLAAGLLLVVGPLVGVLAGTAIIRSIRRFAALSAAERFVFVFSVPMLVVVFLMTVRQPINLNWPAVAIPSMLLLTTRWLVATDGDNAFGPSRQRLARPALVTSAVFSLLLAGLLLAIDATSIAGSKLDPLRQAKGWSELATEVSAVREQLPDPDNTIVLTVGHRYITSELAFYMRGQPRTYRWNESGDVESQYELWPQADVAIGKDALVVVDTTKKPQSVPPDLQQAFASLRSLGEVRVSLGRGGSRSADLYLGESLQSWPRKPEDTWHD